MMDKKRQSRYLQYALPVLLLCCAQFSPVLAQNEPIYRVEVIVFERPFQRESLYRWPGEPDMNEVIDFSESEFETINSGITGLNQPVSPALSLQDRFTADTPDVLINAFEQLEQNNNVIPRVHLAWRQPATPFGEPQRVRVNDGFVVFQEDRGPVSIFGDGANADASTVERIDGHIAFERGRYLHLRLDLALHIASEVPVTGIPLQQNQQQRSQPYKTYRIQERRQIKTGELHYFDHAYFGVLAVVQSIRPE